MTRMARIQRLVRYTLNTLTRQLLIIGLWPLTHAVAEAGICAAYSPVADGGMIKISDFCGAQSPAVDAGMVQIDDFAIDRYAFPNRFGEPPRVWVSWYEAQALCQEQGKRLCTGREWRLAAGGTEDFLYGYAAEFESSRCNTPYYRDGVWKRDYGLAASGEFRTCRSPFGVHDMIGNVWEWTADTAPESTDWRVVRGGSWFNSVNMARIDVEYSRFLTPDYRLDLIGFRCCKDLR